MKRCAVYYDATRSAADPRNARRRKVGWHGARTEVSADHTDVLASCDIERLPVDVAQRDISGAHSVMHDRVADVQPLKRYVFRTPHAELRLTEVKARDAHFLTRSGLNDDRLRRLLAWVVRQGLTLIRSRSEFYNPAGACPPVCAVEARTRPRSCARTCVRSAWRDEDFSSRRGRIIADRRPCKARRADNGADRGDGGDRQCRARPCSSSGRHCEDFATHRRHGSKATAGTRQTNRDPRAAANAGPSRRRTNRNGSDDRCRPPDNFPCRRRR